MMDENNKGFPSWSQMSSDGRLLFVMIALILFIVVGMNVMD